MDRAAARAALERLGRALGGYDAEAAAEAVVTVAEARIEGALRCVSVERGHDPRGAALVAFGGAGGLHACALAAALGCAAVVFPLYAGVLSALGALTGGARRERGRSVLLRGQDSASLASAFRSLERQVLAEFSAAERGRVRLERWAEARYRGQSHELSLPARGDLVAGFHREHARRFGFADPGRAVEVVTVEVRGALPGERVPLPRTAAGRGMAQGVGRARVRHAGGWLAAAVWDRAALRFGRALRGPALVREAGATLWVAPGWSGRVHGSGALVLERREGA